MEKKEQKTDSLVSTQGLVGILVCVLCFNLSVALCAFKFKTIPLLFIPFGLVGLADIGIGLAIRHLLREARLRRCECQTEAKRGIERLAQLVMPEIIRASEHNENLSQWSERCLPLSVNTTESIGLDKACHAYGQGLAILAKDGVASLEQDGPWAAVKGMAESAKPIGPALQSLLDDCALALATRGEALFRAQEALEILEKMGKESNEYSNSSMVDILRGFKNLAEYSSGIGARVSATMRSLMNDKDAASLMSIKKETSHISAELDRLLADLSELGGFSEAIVRANALQLANIRKMAEGIESFSETIRLISMNVNIEAARFSSQGGGSVGKKASGRGFQVLAKNLSDFAVKAQDLAREEGRVIDAAETNLTGVNKDFSHNLRSLLERIPQIKKRLDPFQDIVQTSSAHLEEMIQQLSGLSSSVEEKLKEIIGHLQFHDLTRQEIEHFSEFVASNILEPLQAGGMKPGQALEEGRAQAIRAKMVASYRQLATTLNEKRIIGQYEEKLGLIDEGVGSLRDEEILADGEIKFF